MSDLERCIVTDGKNIIARPANHSDARRLVASLPNGHVEIRREHDGTLLSSRSAKQVGEPGWTSLSTGRRRTRIGRVGE